MRTEFQGEINGLKSDLAARSTRAQQAAADAQAAAAKAEADAQAQQQATTDNSAAVSTLQSTVSDLKTNAVSLATTVSDETTSIKKAINNPDVLHFKGITLSPTGSFLAAETVWRQGATGGDINTPFTGVPLDNSQASQLSEFFGSGRQSRLALKAIGKLPSFTLTGYYEMDWLSARHLEQQSVEQLHAAAAPIVGGRKDHQRLGFLRRPGMVVGDGNYGRPDAWHRDPSRHHRRTVRSGLCVGAAIQFPRLQGYRQGGLHRRFS